MMQKYRINLSVNIQSSCLTFYSLCSLIFHLQWKRSTSSVFSQIFAASVQDVFIITECSESRFEDKV